MNSLQFSFIASFLTVLFSLFFISDFIGKKLKDAGYDISRLILIGLPDNRPEQISRSNKITIPWGFNTTMTSQFDLKNFQEQGYAQGLAALLALVSVAFLYLKLGSTSESLQTVRKFVIDSTLKSARLFSSLRYGKSIRSKKRLSFPPTPPCKPELQNLCMTCR